MDGTGDPDFWWHVMYGKWMMDHGAIPKYDFISWTFDGAPYLLTQWLGQLLIGSVYYSAGTVGTSLLTLGAVLTVVLGAWLVASNNMRPGLMPAMVALSTTTTFWSTYARPQMFGFACMILLVWIVEQARKRGWDKTTLFIAALLMIAWVNLHGSYVVGLLYIGLVGAARSTGQLMSQGTARDVWKEARPWLVAVVVAAVATLLNPTGASAWLYVVEIAGLQSTTTGIIMEWAPTSFGSGVGSTYIILMISGLLAMVVSRRKTTTEDIVLVVGISVFGMLMARQAFYATLMLVPLIARYVDETSFADLIHDKVADKLPMALAGVAVLVCMGAGVALNQQRAAGLEMWKGRIFPVGAVDFMRKERVEGRLFNEVTSGGYLAYHSGQKVFVDGRLDLYKDEHFFEWFFTRMGSPIWSQELAEYNPEVFVLQSQSALTQLLLQGQRHALVYADEGYVVLVAKTEKYQDLIARAKAQQKQFMVFDKKGNLVATPLGW